MDTHWPDPAMEFEVPEQPNHFTGRDKEKTELHKLIIKQNTDIKDSGEKVFGFTRILGMGGVGKTALAVNYAWTYYKNPFKYIFWINSINVEKIVNIFSRILARYNIVQTNDKSIVQQVYQHFSNKDALFIFDGLETTHNLKEKYIPRCYLSTRDDRLPVILITSRNRAHPHVDDLIDFNEIDLDIFKDTDSEQFMKKVLEKFLKNSLPGPVQYRLLDIPKILQNLPFGLRKAGVYITTQGINRSEGELLRNIECFINKYNLDSEAKEILDFNYSEEGSDNFCPKTLYTLWNDTLREISPKNRLCNTILEMMSYLDSTRIPADLFVPYVEWGNQFNLYNTGSTKLEKDLVDEAIKILVMHSLISMSTEKDMYKIHTVVQKVIRLQAQARCSYARLQSAADIMNFCLESQNKISSFDSNLLSHAASVAGHMENYKITEKFCEDLKREISLMKNIILEPFNSLKILLKGVENKDILDKLETINLTNTSVDSDGSTVPCNENKILMTENLRLFREKWAKISKLLSYLNSELVKFKFCADLDVVEDDFSELSTLLCELILSIPDTDTEIQKELTEKSISLFKLLYNYYRLSDCFKKVYQYGKAFITCMFKLNVIEGRSTVIKEIQEKLFEWCKSGDDVAKNKQDEFSDFVKEVMPGAFEVKDIEKNPKEKGMRKLFRRVSSSFRRNGSVKTNYEVE